jgi:hypothetical protein
MRPAKQSRKGTHQFGYQRTSAGRQTFQLEPAMKVVYSVTPLFRDGERWIPELFSNDSLLQLSRSPPQET